MPFRTSGAGDSGGPFKNDQDAQLKARLNNNMPFQRAQHQVFSTIGRIDKLVAYSLATSGGGDSLARTRLNQIQSLLTKFQVENRDTDGDARRKKLFKAIIKSRFQERAGGNADSDEEEPREEENHEGQEEDDDDDFYDDEEDDDESDRSRVGVHGEEQGLPVVHVRRPSESSSDQYQSCEDNQEMQEQNQEDEV
ncbi:hypothetical protein FGO68_gene4903 [Halteria grandinella]|uniref:Uncharacterized protein n=1 Tax=Halteria grandinella TaxID=5974 RepID=A0A8J8NK75_HALGN|nr:hypothetical protein FGO68_gene4903 [Halteria grandinella]